MGDRSWVRSVTFDAFFRAAAPNTFRPTIGRLTGCADTECFAPAASLCAPVLHETTARWLRFARSPHAVQRYLIAKDQDASNHDVPHLLQAPRRPRAWRAALQRYRSPRDQNEVAKWNFPFRRAARRSS
jgi:hypothetical protein